MPLRRAPDVREACAEVYGPDAPPAVGPLQELLGLIGAHEWREKGVHVPALGGRIHPHHGVFSPIRGEYVDLVAEAPLPGDRLAFDVGTGTGVLAAVLARRGVRHVVATDLDARAVECAGANLARLGLDDRVEVVRTDLFPAGRAPLVVCNPPWLPAKPVTPLDHAVYDPGGRMLRGFLDGLAGHLEPEGRAGSSCRTWPSTSACARGPSCWRRSSGRGCAWPPASTSRPGTAGPATPPTRCTRPARPR
ncbi:methyltransferase [Nonomuraea antimicrobica]